MTPAARRTHGRPNLGPAARSARRDRDRPRELRLRGRIRRVKPGQDLLVLRVLGGNGPARRHVGQDLVLAIGAARLLAADRDGDGRLTAADLRERDAAVAWGRLEVHPDGSTRVAVRRLELEVLAPEAA